MSNSIMVANGAGTYPLTSLSSLEVPQAPGVVGTLGFNIASTSSYTGQIAVGICADGVTIERIPDASIFPVIGGAGGIPAGGKGSFTVSVMIPGRVFVYALAGFSGHADFAQLYMAGGFVAPPGAASGGDNVTVVANALGAPFSGQKVIAVTGTAIQGPNLAAVNGIIVTAHPLNTSFTASIGGTVGPHGSTTDTVDGTGNGAFLQPGASQAFAIANANLLDVNGFAGDKFSFGVC